MEKELIIYAGRRFVSLANTSSRSRSIVFTYRKVGNKDIDSDYTYMFKKKLIGGEAIGSVIEVNRDPSSSNTFNGPYQFVAQELGDTSEDEIMAWKAKDLDAFTRNSNYKKQKELSKVMYVGDSVTMIKRAYERLTPGERPQFIANLIYKIAGRSSHGI